MKHGGKKQKIKRNENNLREFWDHGKLPKILITGVQKKKTKGKGMRKYLKR